MTLFSDKKISDRSRLLTPRWWRRLGWRVQDSLGNLIPLATVLLFTAVMVGSYLYLRMEERLREEQTLQQQSQLMLLRINEQLQNKQEDVQRLVYDMVSPAVGIGFDQAARVLLGKDASLQALTWLDSNHRVVSTHHSSILPSRLRRMYGQKWKSAEVSESNEIHWAVVPRDDSVELEVAPAMLRLTAPIQVNNALLGAIVAEFSPQLLLDSVMHEGQTSAITALLEGTGGQRLASSGVVKWFDPVDPNEASRALVPAQSSLPLGILDNQVQLRTAVYRTDSAIAGNGLLILLTLLGLTSAVMLLVNWRLNKRRYDAQSKLREESNFRRAIENSLMTGIRVLDLEGTTTYTNAAFSRMVGWPAEELVGMKAPFPYWPDKDREILMQRFLAELRGDHYAGGLQLRMRRRNGTLFDARIFLTPLLDEKGIQNGWLTTINDITEPNRIRQQLAATHDRFTLVLESLDASITVTPLGSKELLFANRLYRQWFAANSEGHIEMLERAGASAQQESEDSNDEDDALMGLPTEVITSANSERAEIFVESLGKWLEVRSRYLDWVDGRLAQMLIATDITKRKLAEDQAARQVEKMETISRLMTMGEMASSVAHELNQPLAAISNYTNGMITRIKNGSIDKEQLIAPLEKTAHQAVRAGQVIHRIRSFVKRSEPNRETCTPQRLVSEAVELASIEVRKRNTRLGIHLGNALPSLQVDAILIEQVLINLVKNAAEAIDGAQRPVSQRNIDLTVSRQDDGVLFAVADQGPGLPEDAINQLFDAFYSTKQDGMGIGLNLCRSIVESHSGKLRVRNLYNEGSVIGCEFSFWLPATLYLQTSNTDTRTSE